MGTYLQRHAETAAAAAGSDVHASITFGHYGATLRVASTSERAARCDRTEARSDQGPCIEAMHELRQILVPDVAAEARWTPWTACTLGEGFRWFVAVPESAGPHSAVAINYYAERDPGWDRGRADRAAEQVSALARDVAARMSMADVLSRASPPVDAVHDVVDQAVGAIMQANECSTQAATRLLLRMGQGREGLVRAACDVLTAVQGGPTVTRRR